MVANNFTLTGYTNSKIAFNSSTETWRIELLSDPNAYAVTNGTYPPFGTREYVLSNYLVGGSGPILLNLNACNDLIEYNCKDGSCIPIEQRCDSKFDCYDDSDEGECNKIAIPESIPKVKKAIKITNKFSKTDENPPKKLKLQRNFKHQLLKA